MPYISFEELRQIAENLGHRDLTVSGGPARGGAGRRFYRASCACGYMSTPRALESDAVGALVHHVTKAVEYNSTEDVKTHDGTARGARTGRRLVRTTPHRPALTDGLDHDAAPQADTRMERAS